MSTGINKSLNSPEYIKSQLQEVADSKGKGIWGEKYLTTNAKGEFVAKKMDFLMAIEHKMFPKRAFRWLVSVNADVISTLIGALEEKDPEKRLGDRKTEVIYSKTALLKNTNDQKLKFLDADKCASMLEKIKKDEERAQSKETEKGLNETVDAWKKDFPQTLDNKKTDYKNTLLSLQTEINKIEDDYNKTLNEAGKLTTFNEKLENFKEAKTELTTVGVFDKITIEAVTLTKEEQTKAATRAKLKTTLEEVIKNKDMYLSWDIKGTWGTCAKKPIKLFFINLNNFIPKPIKHAFQKLSTTLGIRNAMVDGFKTAGFSEKDAVKYAGKPLDSVRCQRLLSEINAENAHEKRLNDIPNLKKEANSLINNFEDAKKALEKANNEKVLEFTNKKTTLESQLKNLKNEIETAKQKQVELEKEKKLKEENKVKFNEKFNKLTEEFKTKEETYTISSPGNSENNPQDVLIKLKKEIKTSADKYNTMLEKNNKLLPKNTSETFAPIIEESLKSLDTVSTLRNITAPANEFQDKEISNLDDATKTITDAFDKQTKALEIAYEKELETFKLEQSEVEKKLNDLTKAVNPEKITEDIELPSFDVGSLEKLQKRDDAFRKEVDELIKAFTDKKNFFTNNEIKGSPAKSLTDLQSDTNELIIKYDVAVKGAKKWKLSEKFDTVSPISTPVLETLEAVKAPKLQEITECKDAEALKELFRKKTEDLVKAYNNKTQSLNDTKTTVTEKLNKLNEPIKTQKLKEVEAQKQKKIEAEERRKRLEDKIWLAK